VIHTPACIETSRIRVRIKKASREHPRCCLSSVDEQWHDVGKGPIPSPACAKFFQLHQWVSTERFTTVRLDNAVFLRKPSTYVATIFASAFVFEIGFDTSFQKFFDNLNKGVRNIDVASMERHSREVYSIK
jgi:hypothetical protein